MEPLAANPDLAPVSPDAPPEGLGDAMEQINQLNERALAFVRERPLTCLLAALTVGFVVGKIAARF